MVSGRSIFKRLTDIQEAIEIVFNEFKYSLVNRVLSRSNEEIKVFDILGRLIAEDVTAPRSLPWYPRSLVDGCAVRSIDIQGAFEDRPVRLKRLERVKIGTKPDVKIVSGTCAEVDTGAWIPVGADAVVPIEYYNSLENNEVMIERAVSPGSNIAMPASDVSQGDVVITKGTPATPFLAGVLASLGLKEVKASRKVRVALFSTGDELIEVGKPLENLEDPRIYDSNRPYLINEMKNLGWHVIDLGVLPDDIALVKDVIREATKKFDVDLIVASGGTSAGVEDYVYRAVRDLGRILVHGLRLKPGKPTVIGKVYERLFIGLPGNPRSCINVMNKFVKPLLSILGLYWPKEPILTIKSKLVISATGERGRRTFLPVALLNHPFDKESLAIPVAKDSYMIGSLAMSDGQIVVSEHLAEPIKAGSEVDIDVYRFPNCILLVLSDTTSEVLRNSLDKVRGICGNTKIVISPISPQEEILGSLKKIFVLFLDDMRKYIDQKRIDIIAEFPIDIIMLKSQKKNLCKRISIPVSISHIFADMRDKLEEISSNTLAVSVPRTSSSKILFERGYVDCALTLKHNEHKAGSSKRLEVKKLILAYLK